MRMRFALIELVVAVVVLGVLSSVVIPNVLSMSKESKESGNASTLRSVETASDLFTTKYGVYPTEDANGEINYEDGELGERIELDMLVPEFLHKKPKGEFYIDRGGSVVSKVGEELEEDVDVVLPEEMFVFQKLSDGWGVEKLNEEMYEKAGSPKALVVPELYQGEPVVEVMDGAFNDKGLTSIGIPSQMKRIGDFSFYGNKIQALDLSGSLVESIGEYAFYGNQMEHLVFSNSLKVLERDAFYTNSLNVGHNSKANALIIPKSIQRMEDGSLFNNGRDFYIKAPLSTKGKIDKVGDMTADAGAIYEFY